VPVPPASCRAQPAFFVLAALTVLASLAALAGCAGGPGAVPGDPVVPPPPPPEKAAWRPGEALAYVLKPSAGKVRPIDDAYLERTLPYRVRISEAEAHADELRTIEKLDRGGRRTWHLDNGDVVFVSIDVGDDGSIDQTQYFGPEGLFAVVHRFSDGRRTQRIYWPPGEPRIVEIRDTLPPYPGVWWRTEENPFDAP
jgi:hypothetical protein